MPKPATIAKNKKPTPQRAQLSSLVSSVTSQRIDVPLGNGEVLVLQCRDLSVGTARRFVSAGNAGDVDAIVATFLEIADDWGTVDEAGEFVPILDAEGEPWPLNESTVDTLDIAVFTKIGEALGKLAG
jgi:hypothetical protein